MPLLEVTQTRHVSASIRLIDSTAVLADQYAAFIKAPANSFVEDALKHVFAKDRNFQASHDAQIYTNGFLRCAGAHTRPCVIAEGISSKPRSTVP